MKPNINACIKITINSGTALLLWILCFFGLLWMTQHHEAIESEFTIAVAALTTAFGGYLIKRDANQKNNITLQAQTTEANNAKTNTYSSTVASNYSGGDIPDTASGQAKD